MVDKMLRVAGRGEDGKAKALKTDNVGNVGVQVVGKTIEASFSGTEDTEYIFNNMMTGFVISNDGDEDIEFSVSNTSSAGVITIPTSVSEWELGTIYSANGVPDSATNRVRTVDFYNLPPSTTINMEWKAGLKCIIFQYTKDNVFIKSSGFMDTPAEFVTDSRAAKYKLLTQATDTAAVDNMNLELTIIPLSFVVKPNEVFEGQFFPFNIVDINTTSKFRAYGSR